METSEENTTVELTLDDGMIISMVKTVDGLWTVRIGEFNIIWDQSTSELFVTSESFVINIRENIDGYQVYDILMFGYLNLIVEQIDIRSWLVSIESSPSPIFVDYFPSAYYTPGNLTVTHDSILYDGPDETWAAPITSDGITFFFSDT
ncbi:MAG: hypothetical protein U9O98_07980, partial [Asgard group archaeon]|nr:hypothetical protein [Asgard group archaeon]